MRTIDEKNLEMIYEGLGYDQSSYRRGDESNPGSPHYDDGGMEDYIDQYADAIQEYITATYGQSEVIEIEIDDDNFMVRFKYLDDDGSVQTNVEKVKDSDVGADLTPDNDY